jgi:hypothetical protein
MSHVMVNREIQNVFVLRIISLIFEFKILIRPFKIFSVLKYICRSNFKFFKKIPIFLEDENALSL